MTDISEMTNAEINDALATEVMGLKKRCSFEGRECFKNDDDWRWIEDWQPAEDIAQAVECAEKWKKVAEERNIAIVLTWSGYHVQFRVGNKIVGETKNDDLSRALCEAVLMAVRGEGKGFESAMKRVVDENIGAWKALADGDLEGKGSQPTESHGK